MKTSEALKIVGGLSKPSKMPAGLTGYQLLSVNRVEACQVPGSVCRLLCVKGCVSSGPGCTGTGAWRPSGHRSG